MVQSDTGRMMTETKKTIGITEYRDESKSTLIDSMRNAGEGEDKKDDELVKRCQLLMKNGADPNEQDGTGKCALHWACSARNTRMVKLLLNSGADPSIVDDTGLNSLHVAITSMSADCVRLILDHTKELVNTKDSSGTAPILTAVQRGDADSVHILLLSGADVNVHEKVTRRTPLHYALYRRRKDIFKYLLNNAADVTKTDHRGTNIVHRCCAIDDPSFLQLVFSKKLSNIDAALRMEDSEGATPVIVACQNGNPEQLHMLMEAGAPVASRDRFRRCALHHCVDNMDTGCAEYLLRSIPSLLMCTDKEGLTPLYMAVIAGNIQLTRLLLKRGANLQAVDNEKHTVTHWAVVCSRTDILKVLLENGAELSTPDKHQAYPIHYASQMVMKKTENGSGPVDLPILQALLERKASHEVEDKDKRTPIIWAASAGNAEACRLLTEYGANVNKADKDDLTALHCAASRGHDKCVKALIQDCGAHIDPVDKNQCTPLFYAITLGHLSCTKVFLDLKADLSHSDIRGRTAAHCATVSGSTAVFDILRHHQVDLWSRNLKGDQPLHEAAQAGHLDVVQYLLAHSDNQQHAIDTSNTDGRTCLHIAALTNNVLLCKLLLGKGAHVNVLMRNKDKFYTPYDAAIIKGHLETRDILQSYNGMPGSVIAGRAAQAIQVKFRYHRRKKHMLANNHKDRHDSHFTEYKTNIRDVYESQPMGAKDQTSKETVRLCHTNFPTENKDLKENLASLTEEIEAAQVDENKYVDKAIQVTSYTTKLPAKTPDHSPLEYRGNNDNSCTSLTRDKRTDQNTGNRFLIKSQSFESRKENILVNARPDIVLPSPELDKAIGKGKQTVSYRHNSLGENNAVPDHSARNKSPFQGEDSRASDKESSIRDFRRQQRSTPGKACRKMLASWKLRQESFEKEDSEQTIQAADDRFGQECNSDRASDQSLSADKLSVHEHSLNSQNSADSGRDVDSESLFEKPEYSQKQLPTVKKEECQKKNAKITSRESEKHCKSEQQLAVSPDTTDSGFSRDAKMISIMSDIYIATDAKVRAHKSNKAHKKSARARFQNRDVLYNSSSDVPLLEGERNRIDRLDNCQSFCERGNTEEEDVGNRKLSPKQKTSRHSKLIRSVQASVKRFESERRSVRQLHQIRRAQIYNNSVYDSTLFKRMFLSLESSHKRNVSRVVSWQCFIQDQIQGVQNERSKSAGAAKQRHQRNERNDLVDSDQHDKATLQHPQYTRQKTTLDYTTSHADDAHTCSSTSSNIVKQHVSRAQTAHNVRTQTIFDKLSKDNYDLHDQRHSNYGRTLPVRQSHAQQLLFNTCSPFGVETVYRQMSSFRPSARERRLPSMLCLETSTSTGSSSSAQLSKCLTINRSKHDPRDTCISTNVNQPLVRTQANAQTEKSVSIPQPRNASKDYSLIKSSTGM